MVLMAAAFVGMLLLSRLAWLAAWKWRPNTITKAVVLDVVSGVVIIAAEYGASIWAGALSAHPINVAVGLGVMQIFVLLFDLLRVRRQRRRAWLAPVRRTARPAPLQGA